MQFFYVCFLVIETLLLRFLSAFGVWASFCSPRQAWSESKTTKPPLKNFRAWCMAVQNVWFAFKKKSENTTCMHCMRPFCKDLFGAHNVALAPPKRLASAQLLPAKPSATLKIWMSTNHWVIEIEWRIPKSKTPDQVNECNTNLLIKNYSVVSVQFVVTLPPLQLWSSLLC